jgi:hypothetical protein
VPVLSPSASARGDTASSSALWITERQKIAFQNGLAAIDRAVSLVEEAKETVKEKFEETKEKAAEAKEKVEKFMK